MVPISRPRLTWPQLPMERHPTQHLVVVFVVVLVDCCGDIGIVVSDDLCSRRGDFFFRWFRVAVVTINALIVFIIVNFFLFFVVWCCGFIFLVVAGRRSRGLGSSLFLGRCAIINADSFN